MAAPDQSGGLVAHEQDATDVTRRNLLAKLSGLTAAGAAIGLGTSALDASPAEAAGTDRGMAYTVAASNAGSPFQNNADAQCDGTGDEVEINAAINALDALGGGTVELSDGDFSIANPIDMKSNVTIRGQGASATKIKRSANVPMIRMNGTSGSHFSFGKLQDLFLDGNSTNAPGVQMHFSDRNVIERVVFFAIYSSALQCIEAWDSSFNECRWDWCGSRNGGNTPAVVAYLSVDGISGDNTNYLHFTNCVWETFADAAIGFFGSASNHHNNCTFANSHIESRTVRGTPVRFDGCSNMYVRDTSISMGEFENQTSPQDAFVITNSYNIVLDGYYGLPIHVPTQTVRTHLSLQGNNWNIHLESLLFDSSPTNHPSVAAVEFTTAQGANERVYLGAIAYGYDGFGSSVLRTGNPTKNFRSSGTATVSNGSTNVTVNHDLYKVPAAADIAVTPTNNLGNAAKFWVSNVTATTFRINVNANPGPATATFAWQAQVV